MIRSIVLCELTTSYETAYLTLQFGATPLYIASVDGHQECVKQLLAAGASVNEPNEVSVTSCTCILTINMLYTCYAIAISRTGILHMNVLNSYIGWTNSSLVSKLPWSPKVC